MGSEETHRPTYGESGERQKLYEEFLWENRYEELGEDRRVKQILWFGVAVIAGVLLAVILYLIN